MTEWTLVLVAASCLLGFGSGSWLTGLMDRQFWRRWHYCPTCNRLAGEQEGDWEGVSAGQAGEQEGGA